jgi:hypothetical protein
MILRLNFLGKGSSLRRFRAGGTLLKALLFVLALGSSFSALVNFIGSNATGRSPDKYTNGSQYQSSYGHASDGSRRRSAFPLLLHVLLFRVHGIGAMRIIGTRDSDEFGIVGGHH